MTNFIRFPLLLSLILVLAACASGSPTPGNMQPTNIPVPSATTQSPTDNPTLTPVPPTDAPAQANPTHQAQVATPTAYEGNVIQPSAPSSEPPIMQNAAGFESQFAVADKFVLLLAGVSAVPEGQSYQGWLESGDGARLGLGQLAPADDGSLTFEWTSPTGENLLSRYTSFVITLESADGSDTPTGPEVYRGAMTDEQAASVRSLFVTNAGEPATPLNKPLIPGLLTEMEIAIQHIQNAQNANAIGAAAEMRVHLEHIINILEGSDGERFQDYNGDGAAQNPGDGFGVKGYSRQAGLVLNAGELATAIESSANDLQDQAFAIMELEDASSQSAELLTALHTAAEALRDGTIADLYRQADKMAWFPVLPIP